MDSETLTAEEFVKAAKEFYKISNGIGDGWSFHENTLDLHKSYIKKNSFINHDGSARLLKAEFVIFYNLSYAVPAFSFNVWNSCGVLLTLEDIRQMSFVKFNQEHFYSVITQQEHPIFGRPYFITHPCQTSNLLSVFKDTKNVIVTLLSLMAPLIRLNLPLEYGF